MTPQAYIYKQLEDLKSFDPKNLTTNTIEDEIFKLLMSKKFRKYSANETLIEQMKNAIKLNISNNQPINLSFPHGAYKLWRLKEAPLPDWAELFAAMYYTKWLEPICEIYEPGVWFDYYLDDLIVPKIDNISIEDVNRYIKEYKSVLDFLKQYQPKNFAMTVTTFESTYDFPDPFEKKLTENVEKLSQTNPTFTEADLAAVELNAKPTHEQLKDPRWKEKVRIIHDAYMKIKREIGHYYKPDKIPVFSQPLPSGKFLIVGTTKTSIAKFWVGIGALKKTADGFIKYVLSPKQIQNLELLEEPISIEGLKGKNFQTIKVFS